MTFLLIRCCVKNILYFIFHRFTYVLLKGGLNCNLFKAELFRDIILKLSVLLQPRTIPVQFREWSCNPHFIRESHHENVSSRGGEEVS